MCQLSKTLKTVEDGQATLSFSFVRWESKGPHCRGDTALGTQLAWARAGSWVCLSPALSATAFCTLPTKTLSSPCTPSVPASPWELAVVEPVWSLEPMPHIEIWLWTHQSWPRVRYAMLSSLSSSMQLSCRDKTISQSFKEATIRWCVYVHQEPPFILGGWFQDAPVHAWNHYNTTYNTI